MTPLSLRRRMQRLGIAEADLDETFSRSSGPGGQHVNKVSTAVTLRHRLRNISVTVQDSRSQSANRRLALERLIAAIERAEEEQRLARRSAIEKARRRAAKRPRALKERILESKRRRSQIKRGRSSGRTAAQD